MTTHVATPLPEVPGIDLSFRPTSYFWPLGLEKHLLARIKGAERKVALQRLIDVGRLDEVPDFLARSRLSDSDRAATQSDAARIPRLGVRCGDNAARHERRLRCGRLCSHSWPPRRPHHNIQRWEAQCHQWNWRSIRRACGNPHRGDDILLTTESSHTLNTITRRLVIYCE